MAETAKQFLPLDGQVAVVTGASRGIGAAVARRYAAFLEAVVEGREYREEAAIPLEDAPPPAFGCHPGDNPGR